MALETVTLSGRYVDLVPLAHEHHDGLVEAVQDGNLWQLRYTGVPKPEAMSAQIDRCLGLQAMGTMLPFTVFDRTSQRVARLSAAIAQFRWTTA